MVLTLKSSHQLIRNHSAFYWLTENNKITVSLFMKARFMNKLSCWHKQRANVTDLWIYRRQRSGLAAPSTESPSVRPLWSRRRWAARAWGRPWPRRTGSNKYSHDKVLWFIMAPSSSSSKKYSTTYLYDIGVLPATKEQHRLAIPTHITAQESKPLTAEKNH